MATPPDPYVIERLARIRLLLDRADEESRKAPPFAADSISRLHDVAEMYLALACQVHNTPLPKRDFMEYWSNLGAALKRSVPYHAQMVRVNSVRVSLKHHGVEPSPSEIEQARVTVRSLIEDQCQDLFGVAFDAISLSDLVHVQVAKTLVDSAEAHWKNGDVAEALADLSDAFDAVIDDYVDRKKVGYNRSVLDGLPDGPLRRPSRPNVPRDDAMRKMARYVEDTLKVVDKAFKSLNRHTVIVGLGVDLRAFGRFKALTPVVNHYLGGSRSARFPPQTVRTEDDYVFCRDFVVRTALHLAALDYDL